jgi:hypothetical protein
MEFYANSLKTKWKVAVLRPDGSTRYGVLRGYNPENVKARFNLPPGYSFTLVKMVEDTRDCFCDPDIVPLLAPRPKKRKSDKPETVPPTGGSYLPHQAAQAAVDQYYKLRQARRASVKRAQQKWQREGRDELTINLAREAHQRWRERHQTQQPESSQT